MATLRSVLEAIDKPDATALSISLEISKLVTEVMAKEREAWKNAAEMSSDVDKNWWRSKAHALDEVLGDQEAINRIFDRAGTGG